MIQRRLMWAKIALVLLTLGEIDSIYWVLFSAWMTAYPFANSSLWRTRLYLWLTASLLTGISIMDLRANLQHTPDPS